MTKKVSKPGRKPSLSREKIMATALTIVDAEGLDALTLRKLAQTLGVAPMTMYRYFDSKEALLNAMFDYVSSLPDFEACRSTSWRKTVANGFLAIKQSLVSHRGIVPLLSQRYGRGDMTEASAEFLLEALSHSGAGDEKNARAFYALVAFTLGFATMETALRHQAGATDSKSMDQWLVSAEKQYAGLSQEQFPHRLKLVPYMKEAVSEKQFRFGIDAILDQLD